MLWSQDCNVFPCSLLHHLVTFCLFIVRFYWHTQNYLVKSALITEVDEPPIKAADTGHEADMSAVGHEAIPMMRRYYTPHE